MDDGEFERELRRRLGVGPSDAPAAPRAVELYYRWATVKGRLGSFECDNMRARRLLGLEPYEIREENGDYRQVTWTPEDGPFKGVRLADRACNVSFCDELDDYRVWRYLTTTRRRGPPETATVNREVMMLKRIFNLAVKRNTIPRSPLHGFEDEPEDNAREVVFDEEQLDALLTALGDDSLLVAFVLLAFDSGMRLTELRCCRRSWLDPHAGFVHVPGAIAKNGEARKTDLSMRAWDAVQALPRYVRSDLVFLNPETGAPYVQSYLRQRFMAAIERAGILGRDGTRPVIHDLRRSFITVMGRRGIPESVIMEKSGHKDHKVFTRYRIVNETELRESWLRMESGRQQELAELATRRKGNSNVGAVTMR